MGLGLGSGGGGGGKPRATSRTVPAATTGVIATIARKLSSASTFSLLSGSNSNLSISSAGAISATAGITASTSQVANVREAGGGLAIEYPVTLTGRVISDITPAIITSSNPSGSFAEGVAISGTLTANESVTWSKYGADEGLVTLNASTGAWSLSTTNYEAKTSYAWTFTATDGGGNPTNQEVALTITNVYEAANLSALALDNGSVPQSTSATINITGATVGSTITSGTLPSGMTLNSGARTITGIPTTMGTYNFNLTETLADSANSPRVTAVSIVVTDFALPAPVATWISDTFERANPVFGLTQIAVGDVVEATASINSNFIPVFGTATNDIDVPEAQVGSATFVGIPTMAYGTGYYWTFRYQRGGVWSVPSAAVFKTMAVAPPVITSSASASRIENVANPTGTLTADSAVTWSKTGGADAASFSINSTTGVWTLNATPDYETKGSYAVQFTATGAGGAVSQTFTLNITNDVADDAAPVTFATAQGVNRSRHLSLSGGNRTISTADSTGQYAMARATAEAGPSKWQVEFTLTDLDQVNGGNSIVGVANLAVDMDYNDFGGEFYAPGQGDIPGTHIIINPTSWDLRWANYNGASGSRAFADGDIIILRGDKTTGSVEYLVKTGATVTSLGTATSVIGGAWWAFAGLQRPSSTSANFGGATFAYPLSNGYSAYGS